MSSWCFQNFVVRQSSQSDTMALSVRLPPGKGPYIEHYLIQANKGKLSLETSENRFDNIPSLIAHYSQCWWVASLRVRLLLDRIPSTTLLPALSQLPFLAIYLPRSPSRLLWKFYLIESSHLCKDFSSFEVARQHVFIVVSLSLKNDIEILYDYR